MPVSRSRRGQPVWQQPGGQSSQGQSGGHGQSSSGIAVTSLPMARRGRGSQWRTTSRSRRPSRGRPGRPGASVAGARSASSARRQSSSARTSAKRWRSRVPVWPQGQWPRSATWSSSLISRSRSPARRSGGGRGPPPWPHNQPVIAEPVVGATRVADGDLPSGRVDRTGRHRRPQTRGGGRSRRPTRRATVSPPAGQQGRTAPTGGASSHCPGPPPCL